MSALSLTTKTWSSTILEYKATSQNPLLQYVRTLTQISSNSLEKVNRKSKLSSLPVAALKSQHFVNGCKNNSLRILTKGLNGSISLELELSPKELRSSQIWRNILRLLDPKRLLMTLRRVLPLPARLLVLIFPVRLLMLLLFLARLLMLLLFPARLLLLLFPARLMMLLLFPARLLMLLLFPARLLMLIFIQNEV